MLAVCTALSAPSRFVWADGKYLVASESKLLQLRGTNLGKLMLSPVGRIRRRDACGRPAIRQSKETRTVQQCENRAGEQFKQ